eukprot:3540810-Pleurochrysis_carterae.AAC.1
MSSSLSSFSSGEALAEKYHVEEAECLGRGKFSIVHRTRRRSDGQFVALKTIQVFEMGSNERNECMNEIRLLQSMQHPHIISYLDCVMEDNELTVVMELVSPAHTASGMPCTSTRPRPRMGGAKRWWKYLGLRICWLWRFGGSDQGCERGDAFDQHPPVNPVWRACARRATLDRGLRILCACIGLSHPPTLSCASAEERASRRASRVAVHKPNLCAQSIFTRACSTMNGRSPGCHLTSSQRALLRGVFRVALSAWTCPAFALSCVRGVCTAPRPRDSSGTRHDARAPCSQRLASRPLLREGRTALAAPLAGDALSYMHERRVMHRDVKPAVRARTHARARNVARALSTRCARRA